MDKARFVRGFDRVILNPLARHVAGLLPGTALIETTGRRTGRTRRTPVGGKVVNGSFWLVAEFGRRADYVRNLLARPQVRVRVRGRWRDGVANVLDDDDPRERLRSLGGLNPIGVRLLGTDLLTIRIDLTT